VGPVGQYGQLMTGENSQGKGQFYGSCEGVKDGDEVQVRGMSLYWSLMRQAMEFWSEEGISTMVNDMKIQIVRAAMATGNEDWKGEWNGIQLKGYASDPNNQKQFMKTVVEAAIKNDI
jgi:endoglucanase